MTSRSLSKPESRSQPSAFWQNRFPRTAEPLQEKPSQLNQENPSATQHLEALRHFQQTYTLERRCFL